MTERSYHRGLAVSSSAFRLCSWNRKGNIGLSIATKTKQDGLEDLDMGFEPDGRSHKSRKIVPTSQLKDVHDPDNPEDDGSWVDELGRKWYPYIPQGANVQAVLTLTTACLDAGVPVMYVGYPGTGKTTLLTALANTLQRNLYYLSMATMSVEDVAGVMHTKEDKKGRLVTRYANPWWQIGILDDDENARLGKGNAGILGLDEFNTASPSTQRGFLAILAGNRFPSGDKFTKRTGIIGAMNPAGQSDADELSEATKNRICWIPFTPDGNDVRDGFQKRWRSKEPMHIPLVKKSPEQIEKDAIRIAYIVTDYVDNHFDGEYSRLRDDNDNPYVMGVVEGDENAEFIFDQTFASQRSWNNLIEILARLDIDNYDEISNVIEMAVYGTIGRPIGQAFLNELHNKLKEVLTLRELLHLGKDKIPWDSLSTNQFAGIWSEMVKYCKKARLGDTNIKKIFDLAIACHNERGDLFNGATFVNELYKGEFFDKIQWPKLDANGDQIVDPQTHKPARITDLRENKKLTRKYRNELKEQLNDVFIEFASV